MTQKKSTRTTPRGKRRLLKLAAFLEALPKDKFYFGTTLHKVEHNCPTVACAIGWTPVVFPKLTKRFGVKSIGTSGSYVGDRYYSELAMDLFDVSKSDAEALFSPGIHSLSLTALNPLVPPSAVAANIRLFLTFP